MRKIIQIPQFLTLTIFFMVSIEATAQITYVLSSEQKMKVEGTSTLHDWEMVSTQAEGKATITVQSNKIDTISSLVVTLPATSLKSGKKAMDDIAYESLHAEQHPQMRFDLTEVDSITDQLVSAKVKFTIAGTTATIPVEANYKVSGDAIRFTGSFPITFTQFKIDPPKAIFGTIRTGDELQISFEITFKSTN